MKTIQLKFIFAVLLSVVFGGASAVGQVVDDRNLKKNVNPIDNAIKKVLQLKPVSFDYSQDFNKLGLPAGEQFGFIASDVQAVFPEIVQNQGKLVPAGKNSFNTITIQNIDMLSLIPVLVSSIKEQQVEIEKLKNELHSLKNTASVR